MDQKEKKPLGVLTGTQKKFIHYKGHRLLSVPTIKIKFYNFNKYFSSIISKSLHSFQIRNK